MLRLKIEGIYPEGVIKKLTREKIPLFEVKKTDKKSLELCIERKNRKKVFTILEDSCYNITKVRYYGFLSALRRCKERAGLFVGCALFFILCTLSDYPVLRIDVVGTGEYYRREVLQLLSDSGVEEGKPYDGKSASEITAKILALKDVSFCSLKKSGNVLRVEVQTSPSADYCRRGVSLYAAADGRVQTLTVLRGTAAVSTGDEVSAGDLLISCGDENGVVMASAGLACRYEAFVKADDAQEALAACILEIEALNDKDAIGVTITDKRAEDADGGFAVEIDYLLTQSLNM